MPTEWPPKKPAPKPSAPDPESVRKALACYDEACRLWHGDKLTAMQFQYRRANASCVLYAAARAWLEQQDGEASE